MKTLRKIYPTACFGLTGRIGIAILAMAIVFGFAACSNDDDGVTDVLDKTTWIAIVDDDVSIYLFFTSPTVLRADYFEGETSPTNGTYTISGSTVTLRFEHASLNMQGTLSGNTLSLADENGVALEFIKIN